MRPLEHLRPKSPRCTKKPERYQHLVAADLLNSVRTRKPSEMSVEPKRGFRDIAPYRLTGPDETDDTPIGRTWAVELMRAEQIFLLREFWTVPELSNREQRLNDYERNTLQDSKVRVKLYNLGQNPTRPQTHNS